MPCDEWRRHLERYRGAVQAYDEALCALSFVTDPVFDESWKRAESYRKNSESLHAALLRHAHDHGCVSPSIPSGGNQISGASSDDLILGDQGQSGG